MSDAGRQTAYDVLRAVDVDEAYVNLLLPRLLTERRLRGRDAAFVTELTHGTIRWRGTYDAIIDHVVTRDLDPEVRDVLRLGVHQALGMRVPNHAAVSTTVDLVRRRVGHRAAGFVNAVMRRVLQRSLEQWVDTVTARLDPLPAAAIRHSHPEWIVAALKEALADPSELVAALMADNEPPKVTLVARPGLCEADELPGTPGRHSPYARILDGGDPGDLAAVRDGRAGVQDEGSQMVALTLAGAELDGRDAAWLDLCAGPGGKAALLGAIAAQRGAHLVANELQEHRAALVRQAVRQLPDVEVSMHDGRAGPWEAGSFDRILVDAPCTGLGALRRRPESRWRRRPEDVPGLVTLQKALLKRALDLVRPGGVVVYATCSPHLPETDGVIGALTSARKDVEVISRQQWWPHRDETDAMFMAVLRRE